MKIIQIIILSLYFCTETWSLATPSMVESIHWKPLLFQDDGRPRKNISASDFRTALGMCGFTHKHTKGSHEVYEQQLGKIFVLPTVHGTYVKPVYANKLKKLMTKETQASQSKLQDYTEAKVRAILGLKAKAEHRQEKREKRQKKAIAKTEKKKRKAAEKLAIEEQRQEDEKEFWLSLHTDLLELGYSFEHRTAQTRKHVVDLANSIIERFEKREEEIPPALNDIYYQLIEMHIEQFTALETPQLLKGLQEFQTKQAEYIGKVCTLDPQALSFAHMSIVGLKSLAESRSPKLIALLKSQQAAKAAEKEFQLLKQLLAKAEGHQTSRQTQHRDLLISLKENKIDLKSQEGQQFQKFFARPYEMIEVYLALAYWIHFLNIETHKDQDLQSSYDNGFKMFRKIFERYQNREDFFKKYPLFQYPMGKVRERMENLIQQKYQKATRKSKNPLQQKQLLQTVDLLKKSEALAAYQETTTLGPNEISSHAHIYHSLGLHYQKKSKQNSTQEKSQEKAFYYLWQSFQRSKQLIRKDDIYEKTARELALIISTSSHEQFSSIPQTHKNLLAMYLKQDNRSKANTGIIRLFSNSESENTLGSISKQFELIAQQDWLSYSA